MVTVLGNVTYPNFGHWVNSTLGSKVILDPITCQKVHSLIKRVWSDLLLHAITSYPEQLMPLPIYFFKQKNNPKNVLFIPRNVQYKDERKTEIIQGTVNLRLSPVLSVYYCREFLDPMPDKNEHANILSSCSDRQIKYLNRLTRSAFFSWYLLIT